MRQVHGVPFHGLGEDEPALAHPPTTSMSRDKLLATLYPERRVGLGQKPYLVCVALSAHFSCARFAALCSRRLCCHKFVLALLKDEERHLHLLPIKPGFFFANLKKKKISRAVASHGRPWRGKQRNLSLPSKLRGEEIISSHAFLTNHSNVPPGRTRRVGASLLEL